MKKISHILFAGLLLAANLLTAIPADVFASANDFYFKDYIADFYLKKQKDGSSEMNVVETVTAVFPDYDQNHGIERYIPFLNQNDTNLTTESADHLDISVTRNGNNEPYNVITYDDHFLVRIGSADEYVHGDNTYVLKYKFVHTITAFDYSYYASNAYQELYWNANGTESSQTFESVTVNLHMPSDIKNSVLKDKEFSTTSTYKTKDFIHKNNKTAESLGAWCYVGTRGSSNQDRCTITDLSDGIKFSTGRLAARENLTFVVNFKEGTFVVPKNDFVTNSYVDKIEADYTLTKDSDGKAVLKAKEKVVAVFPTKNKVSSFSRTIPFVNKTGYVFTTDSQEKIDVKRSMDDKEPLESGIYTSDSGYFTISMANNDRYLHDKHTFGYEYELKNLVIENKDSQRLIYTPFFGLYDDVNNYKITLHIDESLRKYVEAVTYDDESEKYAAVCNDGNISIKRRNCITVKTDDGYVFYANDVPRNKDFSFEVNFKDGAFNVPEPNRNYVCWHIFIAVVLLAGTFIYFVCRRTHRRVDEKIKYLKSLPIIPEYTTHKDYTVGELAKNYLGITRNAKVATLLELVVAKKISLKKEKKSEHSKSYKWFIILIDDTNLTKEQKDLIKIINKGKDYSVGQEIEIKHHSYSSSLERAFNDYDDHLKKALQEKGLRETSEHLADADEKKKAKKSSFLNTLKWTVIIIFGAAFILGWIEELFDLYIEKTGYTPFSIYEGEFLIPVIIVILFITFLFWPIVSGMTKKYHEHTIKGLEISRYMDGLKLYIKMAETERIKFLQSVENVDTSDDGIVKLHEKLLPYAALLGLEKSWMKELEKYYEIENIEKPDWYNVGLNYSAFTTVNTLMHSATARPIDTSSSSGGFSSSSGSSGGGGGGFSGGGGGGGGFGGW